MKLNRIGAFTFGVVITAGDATIKAYANKSTVVMRYNSKGSCKKTETSLLWNQIGQQGLPGVIASPGAKGEVGAAGAKGQNFHVIDAAGRD